MYGMGVYDGRWALWDMKIFWGMVVVGDTWGGGNWRRRLYMEGGGEIEGRTSLWEKTGSKNKKISHGSYDLNVIWPVKYELFVVNHLYPSLIYNIGSLWALEKFARKTLKINAWRVSISQNYLSHCGRSRVCSPVFLFLVLWYCSKEQVLSPKAMLLPQVIQILIQIFYETNKIFMLQSNPN